MYYLHHSLFKISLLSRFIEPEVMGKTGNFLVHVTEKESMEIIWIQR